MVLEYELTTQVCQMKTKECKKVNHLLKQTQQWLGNDSDHLHLPQFVSHYTLELQSISILAATTISVFYSLITYVSYQTTFNCQYRPGESIPVKIQWLRTISTVIAMIFLYMWFPMGVLLLFRPYQLSGVKRKCASALFFLFSLEALYRLAFQIFQISHSKLSKIQTFPLNAIFLISVIWHIYFIVNHFRALVNGRRVHLFLKMIMPSFFIFVLGIFITTFSYPWYNNVNDKGKYMIAPLSPL